MTLLLALVVVACGGDDAPVGEAPTTSVPTGGDTPLAPEPGETPSNAVGPGISVAEALAFEGSEPVLVNGFVFVYADGTVVVADAMAESFPPQPAGDQMRAEDLDLMQIPLTEGPSDMEIEIVQWTDLPVQVLGSVVDGVLVGATASA
jgi:hypothetical protein